MNTFLAVMAVLLFVTLLGGVTGVLTVDKIKNLLEKPQSPPLPPAPQPISAQELQVIILHRVKNVKEYVVHRQTFDSSFNYHDDRKVFGMSMPLTNNDTKIHYKGEIVCGCDLSRAVYAEDSRNNRIKIIVPCGKILDIHHIAGTLEPEEKKAEIFSREIDLKKCDADLKKDLEKMRQHFISDGVLLQETNEKIRSSLQELISGVNREIEAEIIFMNDSSASDRLDPPDDLPRLGNGR